MRTLLSLVMEVDGIISSENSIGWVGENSLPDEQNFLTVPLAIDDSKFRSFIDAINKSLVESLDLNGKSHQDKEYFWKSFKSSYPGLQYILLKIRAYRNKSNHLKLNDSNTKLYYEFLEEDLEGIMPDFIDDGYLLLQVKILNRLEDELKMILKSVNVIPT